ncbi:MAG: Flp family type IVb pilin [Nocardioidaceae bacterium]|nr:Flp family type IVb pilin [Nocardioidaceae bacterium]
MDIMRSKERSEDGASSVEYGLLIAGIATLIVLVVFLLGGQVVAMFGNTCDQLQAKTGGSSCARN